MRKSEYGFVEKLLLSGDNEPLYVVDGMPVSSDVMSAISPSDIPVHRCLYLIILLTKKMVLFL